MRTRKKPWTGRELSENRGVINEPGELRGKWKEYFGNNNPIHLEIGCGKGKFLAAAASAFPNINYIGLERDPVILAAAARLNRVTAGAPAAYIVSDVENLPELFVTGEIQALYIQFCDPWPNKKKWAKRRLTHARFLNIYRELGIERIYFKTDDRPLFEFSMEQLSENGWIIRNVSRNLHTVPQDPRFITEYESKFAAQGLPIYKLEAYSGPPGGEKVERRNSQDEEPDKADDVHAQEKQDI
ncbi:MAG: tRNA (guanosine(46)-N7)-methyltransferase TrmB [Clostridiales bacterium]|jgi:tRNA (guanine-N7-)-methyltransferase|nr:tRNA (guanosine(46)-N7)-methyltransferase TrmB [Clostridiales bacterium]